MNGEVSSGGGSSRTVPGTRSPGALGISIKPEKLIVGLMAGALFPAIMVVIAGGPSVYFARWERTAVVVIMGVGGFCFFSLFNLGDHLRTEARAQLFWPALLFLVEFPVLLPAPWLDVHRDVLTFLHLDGGPVRIVGLALACAGAVLPVWSEITLGRFYMGRVGVREDHELIRSGPFRVIRHPAYAGELLSQIGFGLAFGLWIGIPVALVAIPILGYRVRVEERILEQAFGEEFREFRRRTWRMIPFVY